MSYHFKNTGGQNKDYDRVAKLTDDEIINEIGMKRVCIAVSEPLLDRVKQMARNDREKALAILLRR